MENKDYSFYSDDNPKNEADSQQGDFVAEPPKKKRKKKTWIVAVSLISVFVVLAGVAAFLFVPISLMDPIENTFEAMFFDTAAIDSLMSTYEKKGDKIEMEVDIPTEVSGLTQKISVKLDSLTVGKGEKAKTETSLTLGTGVKSSDVTYKIYVDEDVVALAGLLAEKDQYVSLPRKDIDKQAEGSVFNPDGSSTYKLKEEDYKTLLSLLKLLSTDKDSKEDAELTAAIDRILKVIEEEMETETEIFFETGRFALSKSVTHSLDSESIKTILTTIIDEAEDNEALDNMIHFSYTDESDIKMTLSEKCKRLKKELKSPSITVSYTVVDGKYTDFYFSYKAKNEYDKYNKTEITVAFLYDEDDFGFDLGWKETTERKDRDSVTLDEYSYRKEEFKSKTTATLKMESNFLIGGKTKPTEKGSSEWTFTYKDGGDWRLEMSDSETKETTELYGTVVIDEKEDTFHFTLDGFFIGKVGAKADLMSISIETPDKDDKITTPEHTNLLEMDEKAFEDFFQSIRLQKLVKVVDKWIGQPLLESLVPMTEEGALFWDTEELIEEATDYYTAYLNWGNSTRVYVYYEKYDIYVLMSKDTVEFTYELTEQQKSLFRKAEVTNGHIKLPK